VRARIRSNALIRVRRRWIGGYRAPRPLALEDHLWPTLSIRHEPHLLVRTSRSRKARSLAEGFPHTYAGHATTGGHDVLPPFE